MEIVRQRRKRLLAWILTLVLCVGMWQGNVQATEGDVPVEVTTATLDYGDNLGDSGAVISFPDDSTIRVTDGTISLPANKNSFTAKAYTGEYEHYLINWSVSGSGIEGSYNSGKENPVETANDQTWIDYNKDEAKGAYGRIDLVFGKILVVNITADGEKQEKQVFQQSSEDENTCYIKLPNKETGILSTDGKFFSGWGIAGEDGSISPIKNDVHSVTYGDALFTESEIVIQGLYDSLTVPGTGEYTLSDKFIYTLGNTGESWNIGDGYTYSGGISFVGPGISYTYTKNN